MEKIEQIFFPIRAKSAADFSEKIFEIIDRNYEFKLVQKTIQQVEFDENFDNPDLLTFYCRQISEIWKKYQEKND